MSDGQKCCVFLPNDKKLELTLQSKLLGLHLLDIVFAHFEIQEKDYFGLCHKSESGNASWIQNDKKILDHDFVKKQSSSVELHFAIKFFVDNVISLKHCLTIELYYLYVKSLVYQGEIDVDCRTAFKLAAHVLQITYGDYTNDTSALANLHQLPVSVIPTKLLQDHPTDHCENSILSFYKDMRGTSKGRAILMYMTTVEYLKTYGIHYYKVKDKSGLPWWLGLSSKGIFQFDFHNKSTPVKAYHWRQLENLYFREKKFSIEVKERLYSDNKGLLDSRKKPTQIKLFAWYGTPGLIKSIWLMSIAQHHFYLESKQRKFNDTHSVAQLAERLTSNKQSLISSTFAGTMTQTRIKDVNVTVKKGSKEESPEVRAAKREMCNALKVRRTELEDRLYDKVQELKKVCLQEAEIRGKYPPEYVRYMDLNEKPPKIKKRVGAEFKLKFRLKDAPALDRDYPTTVTAASSSSSGLGSEVPDLQDELNPLEVDFELLTQIANAAKKLASDRNAKGKIKSARWNSYKKACDKLQEAEKMINALREKCGQELSTRASMFISDEDELMYVEELSLGGKSESEKSSLSDAIRLDDDTSLSSGGDVLSTHSTPALLHANSPYPNSAMLSRKSIPTGETTIDAPAKRSLTPPPSFDRFKDDHAKASKEHQYQYPLPPSPPNDIPTCSPKPVDSTPAISTRNWISQKWALPRSRSSQGWAESSLDGADTISTSSNQSDDTRYVISDSPAKQKSSRQADVSSIRITSGRPMKTKHSSANTNQNNHNEANKRGKKSNQAFNMNEIRREISGDMLSDSSSKGDSVLANSTVRNPSVDGRATAGRSGQGLSKIEESPNPELSRKRSSSLTDCPQHRLHVPHRNSRKNRSKPVQTGAATSNEQYVSNYRRWNVARTASQSDVIEADQPLQISKSRSAQDLQPPIFETNQNIQMQYSQNRATGQSHSHNILNRNWSSETSEPPTTLSHPDLNTLRQPQKPSTYYNPNTGEPGSVYSLLPDPRDQSYHPANLPNAYSSVTVEYPQAFESTSHDDITMDFIPSLNEYHSRASVCETSSVSSRKEDILRVLEDHIAMKRIPSNASSRYAIKDSRKTKSFLKEDRTRPAVRVKPQSIKTTRDSNTNEQYVYSHSTQPDNVVQQKSSSSGETYYRLLTAPKQSRPQQQPQPSFSSADAFYSSTNQRGLPPQMQDSNLKNRIRLQHYLHHHPPPADTHASPEEVYFSQNCHQPHRQTAFNDQYKPLYYPLSTAPFNGNRQQPKLYRWRSESSDMHQQTPTIVQASLPHHRTRSPSETWNVFDRRLREPAMRQFSVDDSSTRDCYESYRLDNPSFFPAYDKQHFRNLSKDHARLSASAENILWSETGGTQSGTLV